MAPCPRCAIIFAFILLTGMAPPARSAEPNNTWSEATDVGVVRQVSDRIDFTTSSADTVLGLYDEMGELWSVDNDGSFFGNGFASAFLGEPVNPDGSIRFAVSGFGDFDLDGLDDESGQGHAESGAFDVLLTVYGSDGRVIESRDLAMQLTLGEATDISTQADTSWIGGSFDLELNNFFGPASDLDYWAFSEVPVGVPFIFEVLGADFDTLIGLYDDAGQLIDADDDGGVGVLSRLDGVTPAGSTIYVAVTSYPDFGFQGVHSATGEYTVRLLVTPEPAAHAVAIVGVALVMLSHETVRGPSRRR